MTEPTPSDARLATQEEFEALLSSVARDHAYAVARGQISEVTAERDALAAELSELRAAVKAAAIEIERKPDSEGATVARKLRNLAAQPQGERGTAILAAVEVVRRHADMVSRACEEDSPIEYSDYENFAFELLRMFAAIDGAKP